MLILKQQLFHQLLAEDRLKKKQTIQNRKFDDL